MKNLSPTAHRIRTADMHDPSGDAGSRVYDNLVKVHGKSLADEMRSEALDELDDYYEVERTDES